MKKYGCCPHAGFAPPGDGDWTVTRRTFLKGMGAATIGGVALSGLSWPAILAAAPEEEAIRDRAASAQG